MHTGLQSAVEDVVAVDVDVAVVVVTVLTLVVVEVEEEVVVVSGWHREQSPAKMLCASASISASAPQYWST